ncbi:MULTISPECIES: hypothetical protein [Achromobacter]|jgi:hypothetical protein|uniref:Uncharacterized protein n=1 Tax=Achromobacter aegrifaciens TaxID=1287736 RepID=A0AAD2QD93_ACHAE|nr:hypothetical protein [Achromobacter aegrifaciens]CUJ01102.1 Uncharacterised protein [Achromobacter aegrifaciens]
MDFSLISGTVTTINSALDLGKAALGLRDANKLAAVVAEMNDKLLNAQQSLFTHNAQLMALQQEHLKATKELAEVKEAIAQRGDYTLVGIGNGFAAYRKNPTPEDSESADPSAAHFEHYLCQVCFDGPGQRKVLMQPLWGGWLGCPVCVSGPVTAQAAPTVIEKLRRR